MTTPTVKIFASDCKKLSTVVKAWRIQATIRPLGQVYRLEQGMGIFVPERPG